MRNLTVREARAIYVAACDEYGRWSREARAAKKALDKALERREGKR